MLWFNEHDAFAAQWLRNLYPQATVDERSIHAVQASDTLGFQRCHFFGGIGGWQYALELAGWPAERSVWTGSCPCQPFSAAGKRKGEADERHLWPEFFRLIRECRPSVILGEQVASRDGLGWLDGVFADLEGQGYACGAADMCAAGAGAPHIRQRLFWLAHSERNRLQGIEQPRRDEAGRGQRLASDGGIVRLADARPQPPRGDTRRIGIDAQAGGIEGERSGETATELARCCGVGGLAFAHGSAGAQGSAVGRGSNQGSNEVARAGPGSNGIPDRLDNAPSKRALDHRPQEPSGNGTHDGIPWQASFIIPCRDGKMRRVGCGIQPLAPRIPKDLGRDEPELRSLAKRARANRTGRLRGYGNSIVPQVAAEFVRAVKSIL